MEIGAGFIAVAVLLIVAIAFGVFLYAHQQKKDERTQNLSTVKDKTNLSISSAYDVTSKYTSIAESVQQKQTSQRKNIHGLSRNVPIMVKDYENKLNILHKQKRVLMQDIFDYISKLTDKTMKLSPSAVPVMKKQLGDFKSFEPRLQQLQKQIDLYSALFGKFRITMIRHIESIPRMEERLDTISRTLDEIRAHYEAVSNKFVELKPMIETVMVFLDRLQTLEEKTGLISVENYELVKSMVEQYKELLPLLNTIPTELLPTSDANAFKSRYYKDRDTAQEEIEHLFKKAEGGVASDEKVAASMHNMKTKVEALQREMINVKRATTDLSMINQLEKQVGTVNLAAVKRDIPNLARLGELTQQIGDANLASYTEHVPNLSRLPSLIENVGAANIAPYSSNVQSLATLPSIQQGVTNTEVSMQTLQTILPSMSSSTTSMKTQVEQLNQNMASKLTSLQEEIKPFSEVFNVTSDGKVVAKNQLCIDDVCIDGAKLKQIMSNHNMVI